MKILFFLNRNVNGFTGKSTLRVIYHKKTHLSNKKIPNKSKGILVNSTVTFRFRL